MQAHPRVAAQLAGWAPGEAVADGDRESESIRDVIAGLRSLGFNALRARLGAASCASIPDASLEDKLRHALRTLAPRCERRPPPVSQARSGDRAPVSA